MHLAILLCKYFIVAMHSFTWQGVYRCYAQSLSAIFISLTIRNKGPNSTKRSVSPLQNASSLSGMYVVAYFLIYFRSAVVCSHTVQLVKSRTLQELEDSETGGGDSP